jgi:LmbE family N-acetylglucosaminyl deacetylase
VAPADVHVPGGGPLGPALERTTDVGVGAHPDDLELFALAPIGACATDASRWFTGITCTDGAGGPRVGRFAGMDDAAWIACRREEQRRAADLGGYAAMIQLGVPSPRLRTAEGFAELVSALARWLEAAGPAAVYTHDPTDPHPTHAAVSLATVAAVRRLEPSRRPARLLGCEGWRSLDWLPERHRVRLDVSPYTELGERLIGVFESQLAAKPYDRAEAGRRRSNAVRNDPGTVDAANAVTLAMDLTPLVLDDGLDPAEFALAAVDRFRSEVEAGLSETLAFGGSPTATPRTQE